MKKLGSEVKIYDETAMDNSYDTSNEKPAVAGEAEGILSVKELSKYEFDAEMDLESEIMREMNQSPMVPDEPLEDTDSSTSEDDDSDPFCGL